MLRDIGQSVGILDIKTVVMEETASRPWENRFKSTETYPVIADIPKIIEIVYSDLLYIAIKKLPTPLINLIRKLATIASQFT